MKEKLIPIIGLMSGTSLDGIDCSLVYSDGQNLQRTEFNSITPYTEKTLQHLNKLLLNPKKEFLNFDFVNSLNQLITYEHANVVNNMLENSKVIPLLIGFHGQTILHDPSNLQSLQLGDGKLLNSILKISTVYNFRLADMHCGGQGAPIAPIYHKFLIEQLNLILPAIIINIGGISNLTYWDGINLIGFDTGPGNKLMDQYMKSTFNKNYDKNGEIAMLGNVDYKLINKYCDNSFYKSKPPKSLDIKNLFENDAYYEILKLDPKDCLATLSYLTAETIKRGLIFLPFHPKSILIVGGGQKNNQLIRNIKKLNICKTYTATEQSLSGDYIESELIAYLSARKFYNLPSTFPHTTGTKKNTVLGKLADSFQN